MPDDAPDAARLAELERRLAAISTYPDATFGVIGTRELLAMGSLFVLLPAVLVWLFR